MKLHEYQSKRLFSEYGIPIPRGDVAFTAAEAVNIASKLGGSVVVKAQVLIGGRGRSRVVKELVSNGIKVELVVAPEGGDRLLTEELAGFTSVGIKVEYADRDGTEKILGRHRDWRVHWHVQSRLRQCARQGPLVLIKSSALMRIFSVAHGITLFKLEI